jgi:hypothetical protein
MAITIKKGNFTLGFTIPTKDELEKARLSGANDKRVRALDDTIQSMFSKDGSRTPTQDYMDTVVPVSNKFGQYGAQLEAQYQKDTDTINNLSNMTKKLNTVPYTSITDEINRLKMQLDSGEISGSAFGIKVASLYKKMYDPKAGVLTNDNVLRLATLDKALDTSIKSYNEITSNVKESKFDSTTGVFTSQLDPNIQNKQNFLKVALTEIDFSGVSIPSIRKGDENKPLPPGLPRPKTPLATFAKDADVNLGNLVNPVIQEFVYAKILGDLQVKNPDLIRGYRDGLNSLGIQGDDINLGIKNRITVLVRNSMKKSGIDLSNEQEDSLIEQVLSEIDAKVETITDSGSYDDTELANYSDAGLKAENEFNEIRKNIDTQFITNVKSFSEVNDILTIMKDQLNLETLLENSDKFDDNEKQLIFKNLDNILIGAFVNKGAAGSSEDVLLGKGLIVVTKFLEDLGVEGINPASLAKSLQIPKENQALWSRAMKRINSAKRDSVQVLESHPVLKERYNRSYDPFDVSHRYSSININLTSALAGQTISLPESDTITTKENKDLLSILEEYNNATQTKTQTVAQTPTEVDTNALGYNVSDNEIDEYKTAAIETIIKHNMLDDMQFLDRFIANYTLEIDDNMSIELQDKFKDMILNTINADSANV